MLCENCGKDIPDNLEVCPNCESTSKSNKKNPISKVKNIFASMSKKVKIISALGVTILVVAIILIATLSSSSGPEAAVKNYKTAYAKRDAKAYVNTLPSKKIDQMIKDGDYDSKKELIEGIQIDWTNYIRLEKFKVNNTEKLKIQEDMKSELIQDSQMKIDEMNLDYTVKDVAKVKIEYSYIENGEAETVEEIIIALNLDGKWYVIE